MVSEGSNVLLKYIWKIQFSLISIIYTAESRFYTLEGTKSKLCKLWENVNCRELFTIHYEIREIEGTWKKCCKWQENVNYGNVKPAFYSIGNYLQFCELFWGENAVNLAAAQGVICGGDPMAGVSMRCLPQCPWQLFLMASTPLPRKIQTGFQLNKSNTNSNVCSFSFFTTIQ
jgi:hypothetical protein